jgi:acetylornithine deacetylase
MDMSTHSTNTQAGKNISRPTAFAAMTVTDILCQLIAIPSVNPMGRNVQGPIYYEGRVSDWLVEFLESIGAPHERIEVAPGRHNVIARYDAPQAAPTLLLDAHQDTVPVDCMTVLPFMPVVQAGRITGRGAADVKGGMAAMLFAFRRLHLERPPNAANVILSCTCDEEATTLGIIDLVRCWQKSVGRSRLLQSPPDGAIVAEPTRLDVVVAHRGVSRFRIRTPGKACHSSDPSQGKNAIYRMARVVTCLEEYADRLGSCVAPHPLCGNATLSVGRIEGGVSVNIVPEHCVIEVDRRVLPGEDIKTLTHELRKFLTSRLNFEIEFESPWLECPALGDHNNRWLADSILKHANHVDPLQPSTGNHRMIGVPFCTHASQISEAGVPAVVFGPGSIEQAHTADEYIEIDQLKKAAEVYYQVCSQASSS